VLVLALASGCSTTDAPADEARCGELRAHLVDLRVRDIHVATGVDREAHRKALTAALGDGFIANCTTKLEDTQVTCMLEAHDQPTATKCVSSTRTDQPAR
jgi:hypothetical protein